MSLLSKERVAMTHGVINTTAITPSIQVKLHKIIYLSGFFSPTARLQNRNAFLRGLSR